MNTSAGANSYRQRPVTSHPCALRLVLILITGLGRPEEAIIARKSRQLAIERLVKSAEN